jgi:hypothetical protein
VGREPESLNTLHSLNTSNVYTNGVRIIKYTHTTAPFSTKFYSRNHCSKPVFGMLWYTLALEFLLEF